MVSIAMHDVETAALKAPFPWFGGKRRVAPMVWERFGDVANYSEPFAGSLAVLLGRPTPPRVETVNDVDRYLSNFWRAVQGDPEQVAYYADYPVNEADLHARHRWLVETAFERIESIKSDPDFYDAKVAGWWVWGQCLWIGSGWCQVGGSSRRATEQVEKRPNLMHEHGKGLFRKTPNGAHQHNRPHLTSGIGLNRKQKNRDNERPHLQSKRPNIADPSGQGVLRQFDRNGLGTTHQARRPHLTSDQGVAASGRRWQGGGQGGGSGVHAPTLGTEGLYQYLTELSVRLRRVRVCCGDWTRVLTPSVTTYMGVTGVFLDPPYSHELRERCYSEDHDISADVRGWALKHGNHPDFRIALCGYEDEHSEHMPASWECVPWKAHGGYSRSDRGKSNRSAERIWFSPGCLKGTQGQLFDDPAEVDQFESIATFMGGGL